MRNSLTALALVATLSALAALPAAADGQLIIPEQDGAQSANILMDLFRDGAGNLFQVVFIDKNSNGKYDSGVDTVLKMVQIDWSPC